MEWLKKVGQALKRAWQWLLDNPVALAGLIGTAVGAFFMWKSQQNKIKTLADAVEVQAQRKRIVAAEARAKVLEEQADAREPEVTELRQEIQESQKRVVELHDGVDVTEMSDEEIARRFADSGL